MKWVEAPPPVKTAYKSEQEKKISKQSSSSSASESPSSDAQGSKAPVTTQNHELRESWMSEETFVPTLDKSKMKSMSGSRQRQIDAQREIREREEKIQNERELNPHWKITGTGLPEIEADVKSLSLPSTSVGDGGYSWLKKAYLRIQEQSQKEGRSMEEIAVERWGSLKKLESMIEEAESRMKNRPDHKKHSSSRHEYEQHDHRNHKKRFKPPHEHDDNHRYDSSFQYKKPTDKNREKRVNQFKSTKNSKYYDYSKYEEKTERKYEKKSNEKPEYCDISVRKSSSKTDRIPAWKKTKCVEEKDSSKEIPVQILEQTYTSLDEPRTAKGLNPDTSMLPVMYSEDEFNKLASRQIKAEIMGDTELALKLKDQVMEARKIIEKNGFAEPGQKKTEEVILTKLDDQGQARPIQSTQEQISDYKQKKSNKYFNDGSSYSLKQMFEREKMTTAADQIEMFVEATVQCDDTAEIDFELGNVSKKLSQKMAVSRDEEKDIGKAMQQHRRRIAALEKCEYCLDQPHLKKYLIIDIGEQVYLYLPNFQTITEGHCLIVPKTHVSSFLSLDENEWREVELFKNHLRNMFRSQKKSVLFVETSMNFRYHPHAVLECIPVPEEEGDMAPLYFKKAIQESEAEWALNKKLIDLKNKGLRHSVPKNLPYFYVEFDPKVHAGYAHVIEEEKCFPRNFGKEVIGGMLDIDYNYLYKNRKEDPLKKSEEVMKFVKLWKKFKTEDA